MSICTKCGLGPEYCNCEPQTWKDVHFSSLGYTNDDFDVEQKLIRSINKYQTDRSDELNGWTSTTQNARVTPRNVRLAYLWAVISIQTDSGTLDAVTADLRLNDFATLKASLEASADGENKWSKVIDFWTSDQPDDVAEHIDAGNWIDAQAVLAGLHEDRGRSYHYCRVVKANMVTALFGDPHALCMDSRRHKALLGTLQSALPEDAKGPDHDHPEDSLGTYRQSSYAGSAKSMPAWSEEFLQEGKAMARSPEEFRVIAKRVLDELDKQTRADRDELHHILFNLGGPETFHKPLQEMMDTR